MTARCAAAYIVRFLDTFDGIDAAPSAGDARFASLDEAEAAARLHEVEAFRLAVLLGPGASRCFLRGRRDPALMRGERVEIPFPPRRPR